MPVAFEVEGVVYPLSERHATMISEDMLRLPDSDEDESISRDVHRVIERALVGESDEPIRLSRSEAEVFRRALEISMVIPPRPADGLALVNALRRLLGHPEVKT